MLKEIETDMAGTAARPGAAGVEESFEILEGETGSGLILLCDHATNRLPEGYGTLGLPPSELKRHIGYDIGVDGVTRGVAARLGVPAILSRFSRLLIDPNRGLDDPTLIMRLSDGAIVPGNANIDECERRYRIDTYYRPYHDMIGALIARCVDCGVVPVLLSIHSFTPRWKGVPRPWHGGILWQREDPRFAVPLIAALAEDSSLVVGDNEPYSGGLAGDTLDRHGTGRGLANALLEIRQDLIQDTDGINSWINRLCEVLPPLLNDKGLFEFRPGFDRDGRQ